MEQLDKGIQHALKAWRQGQASLDQIRSLAADLGNQHFTEGLPELMKLLNHEDEIVRYNAVNSLAFEFQHKPAADQLLAMLVRDSDEDCRRVAAGALGNLFQDSEDKRVLGALGQSALDDPDEDVRKSAYKALLIVNGLSSEKHLQLLTGGSLPVDRDRVKRILAKIG